MDSKDMTESQSDPNANHPDDNNIRIGYYAHLNTSYPSPPPYAMQSTSTVYPSWGDCGLGITIVSGIAGLFASPAIAAFTTCGLSIPLAHFFYNYRGQALPTMDSNDTKLLKRALAIYLQGMGLAAMGWLTLFHTCGSPIDVNVHSTMSILGGLTSATNAAMVAIDIRCHKSYDSTENHLDICSAVVNSSSPLGFTFGLVGWLYDGVKGWKRGARMGNLLTLGYGLLRWTSSHISQGEKNVQQFVTFKMNGIVEPGALVCSPPNHSLTHEQDLIKQIHASPARRVYIMNLGYRECLQRIANTTGREVIIPGKHEVNGETFYDTQILYTQYQILPDFASVYRNLWPNVGLAIISLLG